MLHGAMGTRGEACAWQVLAWPHVVVSCGGVGKLKFVRSIRIAHFARVVSVEYLGVRAGALKRKVLKVLVALIQSCLV